MSQRNPQEAFWAHLVAVLQNSLQIDDAQRVNELARSLMSKVPPNAYQQILKVLQDLRHSRDWARELVSQAAKQSPDFWVRLVLSFQSADDIQSFANKLRPEFIQRLFFDHQVKTPVDFPWARCLEKLHRLRSFDLASATYVAHMLADELANEMSSPRPMSGVEGTLPCLQPLVDYLKRAGVPEKRALAATNEVWPGVISPPLGGRGSLWLKLTSQNGLRLFVAFDERHPNGQLAWANSERQVFPLDRGYPHPDWVRGVMAG